MVPKRKRLHDALLARGYSKDFCESVAYSDKPKLYEPPKDPIKILMILGETYDRKAEVNLGEGLGILVTLQGEEPGDRRDVSVAS